MIIKENHRVIECNECGEIYIVPESSCNCIKIKKGIKSFSGYDDSEPIYIIKDGKTICRYCVA